MKKFLLLTVILFCFISCEEDIRFNDPAFQGLKNNVFWRATDFKAKLATNGSLIIEAYTSNEFLSFTTTSPGKGIYLLGPDSFNIVVYTEDRGIYETNYSTSIGGANGEIKITDYDDINNTISGTFKFNAIYTETISNEEPNLNFQQGFFYNVPIVIVGK
ncbi:hypothetical protein RCH18_000136 [Flavobacterium sp. PL11]|jgi:hypothetical protein|uniref:DUF6252 family protein n=1 Tax=Flavobacterium sp. PL11 TaxID=3071717 RepID=UPI002E0ABC7E|nr:hypothetical protein [Flavobacterium sp. PL11]